MTFKHFAWILVIWVVSGFVFCSKVWANKVVVFSQPEGTAGIQIEPGKVYGQTFMVSEPFGLIDVGIRVIGNQLPKSINFSLFEDESSELIYESEFWLPSSHRERFFSLGFPVIPASESGKYRFEVGVGEEIEIVEAQLLMSEGDVYTDGSAFVNGEEMDYDLAFRIGDDRPFVETLKQTLMAELMSKWQQQKWFFIGYVILLAIVGVGLYRWMTKSSDK